jgi:hypothetical protein
VGALLGLTDGPSDGFLVRSVGVNVGFFVDVVGTTVGDHVLPIEVGPTVGCTVVTVGVSEGSEKVGDGDGNGVLGQKVFVSVGELVGLQVS